MSKSDEIICRKLGTAQAALEAIAEKHLPEGKTPEEYAKQALDRMDKIGKGHK